ncbi:MAG: CoA ester lyase [Nitrospinota bacterium]
MPRPDASIPLRSLLFTPGSNEKMLSKASSSGADAALFDLEDAVAPDMKEKARPMVLQAIKETRAAKGGPPVITVRVNDVTTGLLEGDLEVIVCSELDAIKLAMTDTPADIRAADAILTRLENERGLEADSIGIIALIETAEGLYNCYDICKAAKRVVGIGIGSAEGGDLSNALGCEWTADGRPLFYARSKALADARAAGVPFPTDGPFTRFKDSEGCRQDAIAARQLGYVGKAAIHPNQVEILNDVFSPDADRVAYLREMIEVYYEAERAGAGAVSFNGRMIDIAMVKDGERVLSFAAAIAARDAG